MSRWSASGDEFGTSIRPCWLEVNLDSLRHNLEVVRNAVAPADVVAIVKADAYGHGAATVARYLEGQNVRFFAVAFAEEGIELRRSGLENQILVLGPCGTSQMPQYRRYNLTPIVASFDQLCQWRDWAELENHLQPIHLKFDVGMSRLGIDGSEAREAIQLVRESQLLCLEGLMSHLSDADRVDGSERTSEQERHFLKIVEFLTADERQTVAVHLANSAAALHYPTSRNSMVRAGLALYGLDPARTFLDLRPVMSVHGRIVQLRTAAAGAKVGYGGTWRAEVESELAVVPIGYADGYSWRLSGRSEGILSGQRVPAVGTISMDLTVFDVSGAHAQLGDEIVLLGHQDKSNINAWELSDLAGTMPYELLCGFGRRLPRRYMQAGSETALISKHLS